MNITELTFSDLFVAQEPDESWFKATPDSLVTEAVPEDCREELSKLRALLDSSVGNSNFKVDWPDKNGIRLRVERKEVADSKRVYVCRRYKLLPLPLTKLGMPKGVAEKLLSNELTEGLVIFLGKAGSGKTTTAFSFTCDRLSKFGGVCWTVENPIELPIQGRHGKGMCYQTEVESEDGIGPAIASLYRATPNIIVIGEVRTSAQVREAIAAGTSGHLVVVTFHASDLISGLARLTRMAGDDNASVALSDALKVAIHLQLHNTEEKPLPGTVLTAQGAIGTGTPPRVLSVEPLWVTGDNREGIKSTLRDGQFHQLKSEIERQKRSFMMDKLP
jgi:Tfp pilus assembly pilus retraction ATPase PilT